MQDPIPRGPVQGCISSIHYTHGKLGRHPAIGVPLMHGLSMPLNGLKLLHRLVGRCQEKVIQFQRVEKPWQAGRGSKCIAVRGTPGGGHRRISGAACCYGRAPGHRTAWAAGGAPGSGAATCAPPPPKTLLSPTGVAIMHGVPSYGMGRQVAAVPVGIVMLWWHAPG